jgi:hypothetical protein
MPLKPLQIVVEQTPLTVDSPVAEVYFPASHNLLPKLHWYNYG